MLALTSIITLKKNLYSNVVSNFNFKIQKISGSFGIFQFKLRTHSCKKEKFSSSTRICFQNIRLKTICRKLVMILLMKCDQNYRHGFTNILIHGTQQQNKPTEFRIILLFCTTTLAPFVFFFVQKWQALYRINLLTRRGKKSGLHFCSESGE